MATSRARGRTSALAAAVTLLFVFDLLTGPVGQAVPPRAAVVQVTASQGAAALGNGLPADLLAVVTNAKSGMPVTGLVESNFTIVNHFSLPGQTCGFSNNITSFVDVGTGAYRLQVEPAGCPWTEGEHLGQVTVSSRDANGQAAFALRVERPSTALEVEVAGPLGTDQGLPAPGNRLPATIMVSVSDPVTGEGVQGLRKAAFHVISWGPGVGACGFSGNITEVWVPGLPGQYGVEVALGGNDPTCTWAEGDYLFTLWVTAPPAANVQSLRSRAGMALGALHIVTPGA